MIYINKVVVPLQVENSNSQQFPLTLTMLWLRALSTALIVIIFTSSSFGFTINRIGKPLHPWRSIGSSLLLSPSLRFRSHSADYASITGYPDNAGAGFNGAQMIYYLILRHIQATKNIIKLGTNLQQPRRIYAHKSHLRAIESKPRLPRLRGTRARRGRTLHEEADKGLGQCWQKDTGYFEAEKSDL